MPIEFPVVRIKGRIGPLQSLSAAACMAVHAWAFSASPEEGLKVSTTAAAGASTDPRTDPSAAGAAHRADETPDAKQSALKSADTPDTPAWRSRCQGAARWLDAHPEQTETGMRQRDASRTLTHPELLAELQSRVDADQTARRAWLADRNSASAAANVRNIDADNLRWMVRTFAKMGLPTASQVGEYGLHLTWLLVHHADSNPRFQEISLKEFTKRHAAGEFSADDLARLSDRVAVKFGDPQPYGTLHSWVKGGVDKQTIPNLADIEARRAQLGIMSLADYGCMMHAIRGPAVE